jgi:hypothetical protein
MKLRCTYCSKIVSTEVPDDTVVRAVLECPECVEKNDPEENGYVEEGYLYSHPKKSDEKISKKVDTST